jgi:hypothetical protein
MVKSSPATLNVSGPAVPVSVVAMNKTPKKEPRTGTERGNLLHGE